MTSTEDFYIFGATGPQDTSYMIKENTKINPLKFFDYLQKMSYK